MVIVENTTEVVLVGAFQFRRRLVWLTLARGATVKRDTAQNLFPISLGQSVSGIPFPKRREIDYSVKVIEIRNERL
jgi:hypothetical protein